MSHRRSVKAKSLCGLIAAILIEAAGAMVNAQVTAFTYQGRLTDSDSPANGSYDLRFTLWDAVSGGTQQPQPSPVTVTRGPVSVANGIFTVQLDFTVSAFPGADRFLEIAVRPAGSGGFTILAPRQQITSTPYAIRSSSSASADTAANATIATNATNSAQLGGLGPGQYVLTSDARLSDARNPLPNNASYIQNSNSQQAGSNFNISGSGTAGGTLSANTINATSSLGIGTTPTRARLETRGAVGGTVALFGGEGTGVSLVRDYPFIGFNSYFNSGWKAISPGFGGHLGIEQDIGAMTFYVNGNAAAANAAVAPEEVMRIDQNRNVQAGTPSQGSNFLQSAANGWRDSYRIFRAGNQVASIGMDSSGSKLQFFTGPVVNDSTAAMTIDAPFLIPFNPEPGSVTIHGSLTIAKFLYISNVQAGNLPLCASQLPNNLAIGLCSSSQRYKEEISSYNGGLEVISRLRPVTFKWKRNNERDLGLVAEEVEQVNPLLTYNSNGRVEGVKYDRLSVLLVNSIKEQQTQIEAQRKLLDEQRGLINRQQQQINQQQMTIAHQSRQLNRSLSRGTAQQTQIDGLKQLVCRKRSKVGICKQQ